MKKLISCQFNMDNACVELKYADGSVISICCEAVEEMFADSMYQRAELDYLIYNDPLAYANLILNGDPKAYLKAIPSTSRLTDMSRFRAFESLLDQGSQRMVNGV